MPSVATFQIGRAALAACAVAGALACTQIADDAALSSDGTLTHSDTEADAGAAGSSGSSGNSGSSGSAGTSGGGAAGSGSAGAGSAGAGSAGGAPAQGGSAGQAGGGQAGTGAVAPGVNLISNPDFELGIAPWMAAFGGTLSITVEQAHGGTHSGKVTNRTQAYQGAHYDLTNVVTPGAQYGVNAFARIGNGATSTAPLKMTALFKCVGLPDEYVTVRQLTAASDAAWSELKGGTFTVPTTDACDIVQIAVYVEGPPPGYDIFIDDVTVTRL